jgi:hypothetical protein
LLEKVSEAAREKLNMTYDLGGIAVRLATETDVRSITALIRKIPEGNFLAALGTLKSNGKLTPELLLKALAEDLITFVQLALSLMSGDPSADSSELPTDFGEARPIFAAAGIPRALHDVMWQAIEDAVAEREWEESYRPG